MESRSFPSIFDIAGRYAKHRKRHYLRYGEQRMDRSLALFLVIQHADLKTQQKYLPMIEKAEREGKISSSNLAILQDRIAMREGKKQLYGSQEFTDKITGISYRYPIINPDKLDERRKCMGLQPMKEYDKNWDINDYKKKLPEIERIIKERNRH